MVTNLQTGSRNAIATMDICADTSASTVTESKHASEALAQIVIALETISSIQCTAIALNSGGRMGLESFNYMPNVHLAFAFHI